MRDSKGFERQMDQLASAFNRPPSREVKDAYWRALGGMSDDEFSAAASKAITACDRWPVPKVLLTFGLEERSRLRGAVHGVNAGEGFDGCPTCGAIPQWHKFRTPKAPAVVERMVIRHGTGRPCERFNVMREWL